MPEGRILIVEDNGIIALSIARMLTRRGYSVLPPAATGEEAVAQAREHQPDVIIMDVFLASSLDGITAAETIRSFSDHTAVIFMTGNPQDKRKGNGQDIWLTKPVNEYELVEAVEKCLQQKP